MARSQLLKDIVNGERIENSLLRLKVILSDLGENTLMEWVNGELQGYKDDVPKYRKIKGVPIGTYISNGAWKHTNSSVPLYHLINKDEVEEIKNLIVRDSVVTLNSFIAENKKAEYSETVSNSYCLAISKPELQIASMEIKAPLNAIDGIIKTVKSKLVDIVLELESHFTNLDELDIKTQIEDSTIEKDKVILNLFQIIYDGSISIGDKNKFKKTNIG